MSSDRASIYQDLVNLNIQLGKPEVDHLEILGQLHEILANYNIKNSPSKSDVLDPNLVSNNLYRLLARNFILVFQKLPTKVYDVANDLISHLSVDLPAFDMAAIVLADLFETFPNSLGSLMTFAVSQVYKVLKKGTNNGNVVYLLNSLTKYCTRAEIDDKLQAKLVKIVTKAIATPITYNLNKSGDGSIFVKKNYFLVLRNLMILAVNANYEHLLANSASSSSGGAKMKPESIMSHQHQFQIALLTSMEKSILVGLSNYHKDIRIAAVELLSHVFINFIPTGKFSPIEYLVGLFKLPSSNNWDLTLTHIKDGVNLVKYQDFSSNESEDILYHNISETLLNTGIIETIVFYIQLESVQKSDYLLMNLALILQTILTKFSDLPLDNHLINHNWNIVLKQWTKVFEFLIKEAGPNCHDILLRFVMQSFDPQEDDTVKNANSTKVFKLTTTTSVPKPAKPVDIYHNPYQSSLILTIIELLLPFGIDFNLFMSKEKSEIKDVDEIEKIETPPHSYLVQVLLKLLINENDYIRHYSLGTLLKYSEINDMEINQLILTLFELFNQELQSLESKASETVNTSINSNPLMSVKLLSYALALSGLIKQTECIHLQNATIVKILSFCTQTLKHTTTTSRVSNLRGLSCWTMLTSLITFYNESEFVKLNSSQILIFWKSLLTSQYATSLTGDESTQEREICENLLLRNASLVCLLNYINTVELSPESLKQVQFLLGKAFNYLTYLESHMEVVGDVTNFTGKFNTTGFNVVGITNLLYSNYGFNNKLQFKDYITSAVLYGKRILIKTFTKLVGYLKNDVSSQTIVLVIKIFSDAKLFANDLTDKPKKLKSKKVYNKVTDLDPLAILLNDGNMSFGVTSKFNDFSVCINELIINKDPTTKSRDKNLFYQDPFYINREFKGYIDKSLYRGIGGAWFDSLEELIYKNNSNSIIFDASLVIQNNYSYLEQYSSNLITSLVDVCIELFQVLFPYLTLKVQSSLLEQIRTSLISPNTCKLRYKAISVNIALALHGSLQMCRNKKVALDNDLVLVIFDILKKIQLDNKNLVEINADSIGIASSFLSKKMVSDQLDVYTSLIVNDTDPYKRGKALLSMGRLYYHTNIGFNEVFNVAYQLLNDPNPIMFYYSLSATSLLFEETTISSTALIPKLISRIFSSYITDDFNYDIKDNGLANLKFKFSSIGLISEILKNLVTNLGPNLRSIPELNRQELKCLILSLRYMIGGNAVDDQEAIFIYLVRLLQELIIFDTTLIEDQVGVYSSCLVWVISKNLKLGLATVPSTSLISESIFPFNSNFGLYKLGFDCFSELLKVHGTDTLSKDVIQLIWVSLNMKPCEEVKNLVMLWMESNLEINWFATLNSLFRMSNKKLVSPFIEINFQQKLLPLLQRQKKKTNVTIDFKDEEIENIVGLSEDEKNEPISWEFKLFIYDLLNHLLTLSAKNQSLIEKLKPRIADLVKISFLGSTSPINIIKLRGINLLDKILGVFGDLEDPMYPGVSILDQQQAQIISAIMPCFNVESNAEVIVHTVNVSSKFINLARIKFYSKQRILKTLMFLLEELSSNKFIKFGFLESMSEFNKKSIQISILNCWALVRLNNNPENNEPELLETLQKYNTLLISLWIIALKEFSVTKYTEHDNRELAMYKDYWVNFISVLSLELEENPEFMAKYLDNNASTFFFILFSQCVESLIRNQNVAEVLMSLTKLFKYYELVTILFDDDIFGEIVDLLDRLIFIDEDTHIQCMLVELVAGLFQTYLQNNENLEKGFDKLFELVRLIMLPLFNILPFLKPDFDPQDKQTQVILKKIDSGPHLLTLKTTFANLIDIINKFPDVVKVDLYSCLLYIFGKLYEYDNHYLVSIILPYLKQVVHESKRLNPELVRVFYQAVRSFNTEFTDDIVLTIIILTTVGEIPLNDDDSHKLNTAIVSMLTNNPPMGLQCVKSLIQHSSKTNLLVVKLLVSEIIKSLISEPAAGESTISYDVALQTMAIYTKSESGDKQYKIYCLMIPIILKQSGDNEILHNHLIELIRDNSQAFKKVVNDVLTKEQRDLTEKLVKSAIDDDDNDDSKIELKTFS